MKVEAELIELIKKYYQNVDHCIGYPACLFPNMSGFGEWYTKTGLCDIGLNNAGDPYDAEQYVLSSTEFEQVVIQTVAPWYGIPQGREWGFVTNSGTDGNMHGIYYGAKKLQKETGMLPIVYVSKEAHYSSFRLCDVQNLEVRLIDFDKQGRMDLDCLRRSIDPKRPALMIIAIGSTFMGAIDDQAGIQKVLEELNPIAVYKHLDAALFGGYLPFSEYKDIVSMEKQGYDSIAVSGHKFFGIDEPCGLFLSQIDVLEAQKAYKVEYLNNEMPLINCSRSGLTPLKFYWVLKNIGFDGFAAQVQAMLENTDYLQRKFNEIAYPAWHMPNSNTVFFKRPAEWIRKKYVLANGYLPDYGGELCHIIVMQHVKKSIIDEFIDDLTASLEQ